MKAPALLQLGKEYFSALHEYLTQKNEEPLQRAYELGRSALEGGMGVLDIATMHGEALARLLSTVGDHGEHIRMTRQASTFLAESLSRADMFVHGFQDAIKELEASHQRLRISERMVAIGTMSAGLGHDISNLLLPVRVRMESIERSELTAEVREDLHAIRTCTEHLQHLANGLRLLALNPDEQPNSNESTDLREWWAQVSPLFRNALPQSVTLNHEFQEPLLPVRIAKHLLTQAVFNLVQNAGDVMSQSEGGEVRVSAYPQNSENSVLMIVSDNGPGMTTEVKRRCLEPFFTTKTRAISTGLGLALVNSIVQKTGGRIEIDSEPGRGTSFSLYLPAADQNSLQSSTRREPWCAVVNLKDPRINAYVKSVLESLGAQVNGTDHLEESASSLWVSDTETVESDQVRQFIEADKRRRVILLGQSNVPYTDERVVIFPESSNIRAIRQLLRDAAKACAAAT